MFIFFLPVRSFPDTPIIQSSVKIPSVNVSELKISLAGEGKKGADYNPAKKNYEPIRDAFWTATEK